MGKISTSPTIAGPHHLTHEPGGEDPVVGVPPAAHEATHVAGGADDIDSALDARALGLVNQGDITFHAAAANTLATLAPGAAGTALLSGGAGADLSWGAPAPAAHAATHILAGADPIIGGLDARALNLAAHGEIVFHAAAANTLVALAVGAAGDVLTSGGAGVDVSWAPAAGADTRSETIVVAAINSLDPTLAPAAYRCTGVNDEVEMNAALVAAAAVNGSVMLLEGDYNTVLTLSVAVNVTLKATGWGAVIHFNAGGNAITIAGDNVKLRDFKVVIVAGAGGAGTRPNGVYATGRTNVEISKLWLVGDETEADDGSDSRQVGILFGINMAYSKIESCTIQDFEVHGINLEGTSGNEHTYIEIEGNICYSNEPANTSAGIRLKYANHCTVTGNTCEDNFDGIAMYSVEGNTVVGNTCQGSSNDGIHLFTGSHKNTITGNNCIGNNAVGVMLDATCTLNTITGNTCQTGNNGIHIAGSTWNTVTGNTCFDCANYGIYLSSSAHNNTLSGNTCQGNTWRGIYLNLSNNNAITGNTCNQNVWDGIKLLTSGNCTIVGNICNENDSGNTNTYDGIAIAGTNSDDNLVMCNICNNNDRYGISIATDICERNWVKDNQLQGNTSGPFFDGGTDTKLATISGEFPLSNVGGGAAAVAPVINTTPGGVDIDANDEFAHAKIPLQMEVQQVVRIKIWAYSNVIEAANNMLLRIVAHGAASSELWSGNPIDVINHPSEETGGIVVTDVIHWLIDATDDAQVGTLAAQDLVELMAIGEAAVAPDIATDALFGGYEIEYV